MTALPSRGQRPTGLAVALIGVGTYLLSSVFPGELPAVTAALAAGAALGPLLRPDPAMAASIIKKVLPVAIVLVGLRISFQQIRALGIETLVLVVVGLALGLGTAILGARAVGVPRRLGLLLALGTAVCGNTAILAATPILRARREEVAYAVSTITVFGTAAVLVFPTIGHALGLSDTQFGVWCGIGVNDTSQVLATGFAYSGSAGETATVVKLARNVFLGPILFGLVLAWRGREESASVSPRTPSLGIPWFVWGFLGVAALTSLGVVPDRLGAVSESVVMILILVAMAAVGLSMQVAALRVLGPLPFVVGLLSMACLSGVVLVAVLLGVGP